MMEMIKRALLLITLVLAGGYIDFTLGSTEVERYATENILLYVEIEEIKKYSDNLLRQVEGKEDTIASLKEEIQRMIDNPVERVVEVEKPFLVEVVKYKELEDWENEEELKAFLELDNTDSLVILTANEDGVIKLNDQCEDRALQLIKGATVKGKRLFFIPLHRMEYLKWYNKDIDRNLYHAICGALIGDNEFWYIEPSDDRAWLALYLD